MARPHRIEFPNAFYHVITRGNQQQDIFSDDSDKTAYLNLITRYKEKCRFVLYAYVLMNNHVHLLIEATDLPISKIMQRINQTYTQHFNRKYGKAGHLFQGRYKAILCDRDAYLMGLIRYIHLNPVRAKIVRRPEEYAWSSHREYLAGKSQLTDVERGLRLFSESKAQARRRYEQFVSETLGEGRNETYYSAIQHQILGDEKFVEKVEKTIGRTEKPFRKPALDDLFRAVEKITGIGRDTVILRRRNEEIVFARAVLICAWKESGGKLNDLRPIFKRDLSTLSKAAQRAESPEGQKVVQKVLKELHSHIHA